MDLLMTIDRLPDGFRPFHVKEVVDGDTYKIDADLNGDTKPDSVRVRGINTTEMGKGRYLKSRIRGAEPEAVEAREFLGSLLKGQMVYINTSRRDGYRRILSHTYIKFSCCPQTYVDLSAIILMEGWAQPFFIDPTEGEKASEEYYLQLKEWAEMFGLGLWNKDREPTLKITSFHPNAKRVWKNEEPVTGEYIRVVNASDEKIDLDEYYLLNDVSDERRRLPHCIVPPGRTVRIVTGGVETQCDPDEELVVSLGLEEPFWENDNEGGACVVILDYTCKRVVTSSSKYGYFPCP